MTAPRRREESFRCLPPDGTRKSSFPSAAKARQAIRAHKNPGVPLYPYLCPDCQFWHITKIPQRKGGKS